MLAFFFAFLAFFYSLHSPAADETIHYQIRPVPEADRTILEIFVRFKTSNGNSVNIKLPTDYYGTPNLYRYVSSFEGQMGTVINQGKDESERIVKPDQNGDIQLKYIVSYDPKTLSGTYSPNVSAKHFHVAGCQWALQIGDIKEKHLLSIEMIDLPKDWQMYSSSSDNPLKFETNASYEDLISTAIGGGEKQSFRQFKFKGKSISVFNQGKFNIPDLEIFNAVRKIVSLQRTWFSDYDQQFYNVVILPKDENIAGVRIENQFICFIKKDITRQQLYVLLAHEMFHNWVNTELIKPEKDVNPLRYAWFYEGVNDYFARKILLDAKLLSEKQFVYLINRDIINIADNPHRATTFDELVDAANTGKFNQAFNKLSYYRGALMALNWEARIHSSNKDKSLGDLIKEVYALAKKTGGISEQEFFEVAKHYDVDAKSDFEHYILQGEPIKIEGNALGALFTLKESASASYDPGFDLNESLKEKKVVGLKVGSAAFQAGLRNGMVVSDGENLNRFGNAWNPDKPMIIVVKDEKLTRRIEFFPNGSPHKLLLFQSKI